ncbi:MAG TPA: GtrA family protein [Bacillota bacterium]|nr:GtrA family protein [Bacillota bacterium]HOK68715.1 GtrA family protein [Bacillota bacterium]HPP85747.1 GtrA family protein [Bacillota bacterium]
MVHIVDYKKYLNAAVLREFLRYCAVGGLAFLVDYGVLYLFYHRIFAHIDAAVFGFLDVRNTLAIACGFIAGLTANYILSVLFVFTNEKQKSKNNLKAFLIYAIVGIVGLGINEIGMNLGKAVLAESYERFLLLVKMVVAGIALVWNYIGRKVFVYKGE